MNELKDLKVLVQTILINIELNQSSNDNITLAKADQK